MGGCILLKAVWEAPQYGCCRLLQVPSTVRYFVWKHMSEQFATWCSIQPDSLATSWICSGVKMSSYRKSAKVQYFTGHGAIHFLIWYNKNHFWLGITSLYLLQHLLWLQMKLAVWYSTVCFRTNQRPERQHVKLHQGTYETTTQRYFLFCSLANTFNEITRNLFNQLLGAMLIQAPIGTPTLPFVEVRCLNCEY